MKHRKGSPVLFAVALMLAPSWAAATFTIPRSVVGNGGTVSSGAANQIHGTAGQAVIGLTASPTTTHEIGFWYIVRDLTTVNVDEVGPLIPTVYSMGQNYPNPFNPRTTIRFGIPKAGAATLSIFDVSGREVVTLVDEVLAPGMYTIAFQNERLASGVYFYRLRSGDFTKIRRMLLLK